MPATITWDKSHAHLWIGTATLTDAGPGDHDAVTDVFGAYGTDGVRWRSCHVTPEATTGFTALEFYRVAPRPALVTLTNADFELNNGTEFTGWTRAEAGTSTVTVGTGYTGDGVTLTIDALNSAASVNETAGALVDGVDYLASCVAKVNDITSSPTMKVLFGTGTSVASPTLTTGFVTYFFRGIVATTTNLWCSSNTNCASKILTLDDVTLVPVGTAIADDPTAVLNPVVSGTASVIASGVITAAGGNLGSEFPEDGLRLVASGGGGAESMAVKIYLRE